MRIDHADLEVRCAVALDPTTQRRILARLSQDEAAMVRAAVAINPSCPEQLRDRILRDVDARAAIPAYPSFCPAEMLVRLSTDSAAVVRMAVAASPSCPTEVLDRLSEDPEPGVRAYVVNNPNGQFERLLADIDVRRLTALDPLCPPDRLASLSEDPEPEVRLAVASRPDCPPDLLGRLLDDVEVRLCAASNPDGPPDVLAWLAEDPDPAVREAARRSIQGEPPLPPPSQYEYHPLPPDVSRTPRSAAARQSIHHPDWDAVVNEVREAARAEAYNLWAHILNRVLTGTDSRPQRWWYAVNRLILVADGVLNEEQARNMLDNADENDDRLNRMAASLPVDIQLTLLQAAKEAVQADGAVGETERSNLARLISDMWQINMADAYRRCDQLLA